MLSAIVVLFVLRYFLGLLYFLEEVLDLLQELKGLLGFWLLPRHDVVRLVVHLLEIRLKFVLYGNRRRDLGTSRWLEGLTFEVSVTLFELIGFRSCLLARLRLLCLDFAALVLSVLCGEQGRLQLVRLGCHERISELSIFLLGVRIDLLALGRHLLALEEGKGICLRVRIR